MAVTCGFFNALEHDRLYDAIQMSSIFDGIIRDGIFSTIGTSMAVTASGSGLVVNVGAGRAWFNHTWILNDTLYPVEAETAEVVLDRIDALVIEINQSAEIRDCSIKFVKGTPSSRPVRPTMTHNAEVNQYALAYISIRAGQTTIFQADITSVIGNDETPFVTGLLQQTSIESIVAQWQDEFYTYFNNFRSTTTSDFNTWMAARVAEYNAWYAAMEAEGQADLAEFDSWFQEMKDQLSEDAAGHLQAEIDALELSAEKGSVVIVTTSDDTLINHACTISQGSSERNATFDINRVATFESIPFVGNMHITATNGTMIASKDINIPYFGRYNYDLEFWEATLAISSSSTELYERPITITKGGTTVGTTSFDNTGHATFKVHEPGTYTVTSTATGGAVFTANVEVTAETSYSVDLGTPIGRTALPTDDIQLWLKCGGEYDVTYTTLAEVLADTELFARLCADSNACDYMARSTTWAKENGPAIPAMTSNTTPSGEVIATSSTNAYKAFDGIYGDTAEAALPRSVGSYIGYLFTENTSVRKVKFVSNYTDGNTYKIQGFDGTNWNDIVTFTGNGPTSAADHIYSTQYIDLPLNTPSYSGYRIYTNSVTSSGGNSGMWEIQFYELADITTNSTAMQIVGMFDYCAEALLSDSTWCEALANSTYWEYIFDGCVPKMTSNTTPSGEVTGTTPRDATTYALWKAFDRDTSTIYSGNVNTAANNTGIGFIQYHHIKPVCIKGIKLQSHTNNVYPYKSVKVEVSNDGSIYDTIFDDSVDFVTGFVDISDNIKTGTYTKVTVTQLNNTSASTYFPRIIDCQFYGRAKTAEYTPLVPTMTSNTTPSGEAATDAFYASAWDAWKAFAASSEGRGWMPSGSGSQAGIGAKVWYKFPESVVPNKISISRKDTTSGSTSTIRVVGSNDNGATWDTLLDNFTFANDYDSSATTAFANFAEAIIPNSDEYEWVGIQLISTTHSFDNGQGFRIQFYSEPPTGITIRSAANDTIYYLDGSTPVTVAVTDANGKAVIDTEDLDPGTYTLYSTVAKNPDNLSNAYTKTVKINGNTTEVYVMPTIGVLYWYGYLDSNCEDCSLANGWSDNEYSSAGFNTVAHYTNYVDIVASADASTIDCAIGTKNAVNCSKLHAIGKYTRSDEKQGLASKSTKIFNRTFNVKFSSSSIQHITANVTSGIYYIYAGASFSNSINVNALWYE